MGDEHQYSKIRQSEQDAGFSDEKLLVERLPLPPLSEEEQEEVARNRRLFLEHMPEFLKFFEDAYEVNLISGWRAVKVHPLRIAEAQHPVNNKATNDEQ